MSSLRVVVGFLVLGAAAAEAQPCVSQAKRSIEQAVRLAGRSDSAGAHRLLEQAERECPTSFVVFRELARIYELLGDAGKAQECAARANRLDPRGLPPQPTTADGKSFVGDKWALVVGVSRFKNPSIPQLEFAAKDASDIARVLVDPGIGRFRDDGLHVRLLTDDQATLANLRAEINNISKSAREEDLVLLYISSHGTSAADDRTAQVQAKTGYIVMNDTETSNLYGTAFPMDELKRVVVDRLRAHRVVTLLDTCFSGDTVRWAAGGKALTVIPSASFEAIAQGTGRVLIVSSQGTERSWEGEGNSYFTKCLVDALRLKGGVATVTEVFNHLRSTVPYLVKKEKNAPQNPVMWPEGRRIDIVIGTPIQ